MLLGRLAGLARAAARSRAAELLDAFRAREASASRQVKTYSGGMRRRLDLAASILVRADLYFLDEPTTGLDPASRAQIWQIIRAVAADGAAVLLTTQYLDEADQLSDRVAVIDHGTVIAEGTTSELKAAAGAGTVTIRLADPARRADAGRLLGRSLGIPVQDGPDPTVITASIPATLAAPPPAEQAASAITELAQAGIRVGGFSIGQPSLDEVFLSLTGR